MHLESIFMKINSLFFQLAAAFLAVVSLPAAAQQKLLPAQSEVSFVFKQMGVPVQGHFKKFDAQLSFDAAKPATNKVNFTVDIASATIGAPESDAELPKAEWFSSTTVALFRRLPRQMASRYGRPRPKKGWGTACPAPPTSS